MQHEAHGFDVTREEAGLRLDGCLARRLGISRAEVRALLLRGAVRVAGRRAGIAEKGERLAAGQRVEVAAFTPRAAQRIAARAEPAFARLASGPGWVALDKPPGVPVRPKAEDETGTLANFAAALHPEMQGVGEGGLRSGVVHRLDVDTSGAVLFATQEESWRRLRAAFRHHKVSKTYRAIALGELTPEGRAEVGLVVARHRPARVDVVDPSQAGARRGRLAWRVAERLAGACLLEIQLETGFLHQIRATLAHLGAPVAGDRVYGPPQGSDASGAPRQMLHAAHLAFEEIEVVSPDPPDFAAALARLRR